MSQATFALPGLTLITGANGGIGIHVTELLLNAGVRQVVCQYRSSKADLEQLFRKHDLDPSKHLFRAELSDEAQVSELRQSIESAQSQPVLGLVNFAGASTNAVSWKMSLADFRSVVDSNLTSTFLCVREFLPGMRNAGKGRIVTTSSVVAHTGVAGASHYCASKAGVEGFVRAVALETANKNITVNSLALGYFDYGIINQVPAPLLASIKENIPVKRLGKANEIFGALQFLLSEDSAFFTGQVMHLNGGQRL